jgi:hypothetical protein
MSSLTRAFGLVALGVVLFPSQAAATPQPGAKVDTPQHTSVYTDDGLLGPIRVVPTAGVGVPDGMRFGIFAKWKGVLAMGGAFSLIPATKVPGLDAELARASGEGFARIYPFQGAFFVGVAGGYAQTKGTMTETRVAFKQPQSIDGHAYANTAYVSPHLGFQWMLPFGLTAGFDVGCEIPIASNGPTFDVAKYGLVIPVEPSGTAAKTSHFLAVTPIPVIHLLELGYAL